MCRPAGVPTELLNPRDTWQDKETYDRGAAELAEKFRSNIERFADEVTAEVLEAGP